MLQNVLIVENNLLLGAGIESLLAREVYLEVTGITPGDEAALVEKIWQSQPDVIILNAASPLIDLTKLLTRLKDYPKLRIVVVSANDDSVQIYDKQQVLATRHNDLAAVIRGNCCLA